ncbi:MAG: hypothetical protein KatS3mg121_0212 [Gammaproteobacteria bacterium]|nr:MAG: hypothetical protein KatS3mg121_0212 [Gammaproteobacteria bacterium]
MKSVRPLHPGVWLLALLASPAALSESAAEVRDGQGRLWRWQAGTVSLCAPVNGPCRWSQSLPDAPRHGQVHLLAADDGLWAASGRMLYRLDARGRIEVVRRFDAPVDALHLDPQKRQVMVSTGRYVVVLDRRGQEVNRIRIRYANIAARFHSTSGRRA